VKIELSSQWFQSDVVLLLLDSAQKTALKTSLALGAQIARGGDWQVKKPLTNYWAAVSLTPTFDMSRPDQSIPALFRLIALCEQFGLVRGIPIADLATRTYRAEHPLELDPRLVLDVVRFNRLRSLRLQAFEPWLRGDRPVRNLAAFREFHAGLSAAESLLARCLVEHVTLSLTAPCASGCHPMPYAAEMGNLVAAGWARPNPHGHANIFEKGPKAGLLNMAAGEAASP